MKTPQEKTADIIINYFFQNCSAYVRKQDYDYLVEQLNQLLAEHTIK